MSTNYIQAINTLGLPQVVDKRQIYVHENLKNPGFSQADKTAAFNKMCQDTFQRIDYMKEARKTGQPVADLYDVYQTNDIEAQKVKIKPDKQVYSLGPDTIVIHSQENPQTWFNSKPIAGT